MSFIKNFAQTWFRDVVVLLALSTWYPGFEIPSNFIALSLTALTLTLIQIFLEPLIKALLLPVNIVTLGLFKWLVEAVVLLLLAYILDGVNFLAFNYDQFSILGITVPAGQINILFSVILGSIFYRFLQEIVKKLSS